jgi:hypothetical protein
MVDLEGRRRIQALEAQGVQRDRAIADLSGRLSRLAAALGAIRAEVSVPASPRPIDSPAIPPNPPMSKPAVPSVPGAPHAPSPFASLIAPAARPPAPTSAVSSSPTNRSPAGASTPGPAAALPPPPAGFASLIVADCPALLAEFHGKRFTLLWRGSRDGFRGKNFHDRCDGHADTLTFIEDTAGNIFGGFTAVKWKSRGGPTADPSLKSFLFTLKNPHNFRVSKFALTAKGMNEAIECRSSWGPHFCDIGVYDNCNANALSITLLFGGSYANHTGLDGRTFFTGSTNFTVKEIEVFEIAD